MSEKTPNERREFSPRIVELTGDARILSDQYSPFRDPEPSKNKRRPSNAPDTAARTNCKATAIDCDVAHWRGQVPGGA